MHAKLKHAQRGQAIAETIVFLPMFLLSLFGIIWAVQVAVQYERVESAVRYAGIVSQHVNPYTDYSLYSLYTQVGSASMPTITCVAPLTTPLSDAAPTYISAYLNTTSNPFWQPYSAVPTCPSASVTGIPAGHDFNVDAMFIVEQPGITSTISAPSFLKPVLGTLTSATAQAYFIRQPGVNVIIACYASLNTKIQYSLNYVSDGNDASPPVALPSTVPPNTPHLQTNCERFL